MRDSRDTIIVTGSREWDDSETMHIWIDWAWHQMIPAGLTPQLVHGGAAGADTMAGALWPEPGTIHRRPVDPAIDGPWPAAGHRRNIRMVDEFIVRTRIGLAFAAKPALFEATSKRGGTVQCACYMMRRGLPVVVVTPGARP